MDNPINAVLVDDEKAFINTMRILMDGQPLVKIVGEARSVEQALQVIVDVEPNLIFLDVEMEDGTGFDLLKKLGFRENIYVIFVTAFDHYAVEAFRFSAIDYLLKPVDSEELREAIGRAKRLINQQANQNINVLLENVQSSNRDRKKIVLKEVDTHHIIELDDILSCSAEGSYTKFNLSSGSHVIVSKHLKEYEDLLKPNGFFRTHRSHLVNLDKIKRFEKSDGGIVYLQEGLVVPVSVRKKEQLASILSHL